MANYTIKTEELSRFQNIDLEDSTFEMEDVELNEVDKNGEYFSLSFKGEQSSEFETDEGDWLTPTMTYLIEHEVWINEIKIIDVDCNEIELTDEQYKDIEETLIDLLKKI